MVADIAGSIDKTAGQSLAGRAAGRQAKALGIRGGRAASRLEQRVHMKSVLVMVLTPTATITSIVQMLTILELITRRLTIT